MGVNSRKDNRKALDLEIDRVLRKYNCDFPTELHELYVEALRHYDPFYQFNLFLNKDFGMGFEEYVSGKQNLPYEFSMEDFDGE